MADIFLSYAREDRAIAERLASAIEASGKSVWWDRHIKGGAQFSKDIERELNAARHILVLWSAASVESRWVRDEASHAADNDRLVSASIDGTMPPLGFRQFHTVDLQGWEKRGGSIPAELAEAFDVEPAVTGTSTAALRASQPRKWRLASAIALALALAGGTYVVTQGLPGTSAEQSGSASLAVMPFAVLGDEERGFLGPGMAGAITSELSTLAGLQLTANSSAAALASQGLTAAQLGEQLGVSYLVEGQLTIAGDDIRATINLVQAANGRQVWSRSYTGEIARTQGLTNTIVRDVAAALQSRLGVGDGRVAVSTNVDARAYEAYLRAREAQTNRFREENRREAFSQYRRAVQIEPDFVEAQAGLAYLVALSQPRLLGLNREEARSIVDDALDRALALDPDNLMARTAQAQTLLLMDGRIGEALAMSTEVVADAPDFTPALYVHGSILNTSGDVKGAVEYLDRARRGDPFDQNMQDAYSFALLSTGDYERVAGYFRNCLNCEYLLFNWVSALVSLGNEEQFEFDWPRINERGLQTGAPQAIFDLAKPFVEASVSGRPTPVPEPLQQNDSRVMRMIAFGGEPEKLLEGLANPPQLSNEFWVLGFTLPGRDVPSEAIRSDPRYHAAFDTPFLRETIEMRRKAGHTTGLPVFPVKPYSGSTP